MSASKVIAIALGLSKRLIVYMEMLKQKGKGREVDLRKKYSSLCEVVGKSCFLLVDAWRPPCPRFQPAVLPRRHLHFWKLHEPL